MDEPPSPAPPSSSSLDSPSSSSKCSRSSCLSRLLVSAPPRRGRQTVLPRPRARAAQAAPASCPALHPL